MRCWNRMATDMMIMEKDLNHAIRGSCSLLLSSKSYSLAVFYPVHCWLQMLIVKKEINTVVSTCEAFNSLDSRKMWICRNQALLNVQGSHPCLDRCFPGEAVQRAPLQSAEWLWSGGANTIISLKMPWDLHLCFEYSTHMGCWHLESSRLSAGWSLRPGT